MTKRIRLTARDVQLKHVLTYMGSVVLAQQLAWFWDCSIKNAHRRLEVLVAAGVLNRLVTQLRLAPIFSAPRLVWRVGTPLPTVGSTSYRSRSDWLRWPAVSRTVYFASRSVLRECGVRRSFSRKKLGHDAVITQVAMTYMRTRPWEWPLFRHESLTGHIRIGRTVPDALLIEPDSMQVLRAIEISSGYRTDTLRRKLEACHEQGVDLEIWG